MRHQGAADRAHLLLAAGHRPRLLVAPLGESREEVEDAGDVVLERRAVVALEGSHLEVLEYRHAREEAAALGRLRDPRLDDRVGRLLCDLAPLEADRPFPGMIEADDRAQGGRLSGAVRADQSHDLALADLERDTFQRVDRAVVGVDVLEREDDVVGRLRHAPRPPCRGTPRRRARRSAPRAACPLRSSRRTRARSPDPRRPSRPSCRARSEGR